MLLIARNWRKPRLVVIFFIVEFCFTIPALVLYALADPNEYRTKLWEDGAANGFNSSPKTALYEAANYRPVHIPLVWQPFITHYNVIASVLITFLLLVKAVMFTLHIWIPILSFLVHAACTALFAYSVRVQAMSDLSDPEHPSHGPPWYISKSCSVAHWQTNIAWCQQAKAAFAITIILVIIFGTNTLWALYSCIPTPEERETHRRHREEEEEVDVLEKWSPDTADEVYEMRKWGNSPGSPMLPNSPWLNSGNVGGGVGYFGGFGGGGKSDAKVLAAEEEKEQRQSKRRSWREKFTRGGRLAPGPEQEQPNIGAVLGGSNTSPGGWGAGNSPLEYPNTTRGAHALPADGAVVTPRTMAFRRLGG